MGAVSVYNKMARKQAYTWQAAVLRSGIAWSREVKIGMGSWAAIVLMVVREEGGIRNSRHGLDEDHRWGGDHMVPVD